MTGSFRLRIGMISVVGIISVVIGGHFGGGDHFDGGDHFGGGTTVSTLSYLVGKYIWIHDVTSPPAPRSKDQELPRICHCCMCLG